MDTTGFQIHPDVVGDNEGETAHLRDATEEAISFIRGFKWAPPIKRLRLAWGVGGLLCLFLVEFERKIARAPDDKLWVVVGDLPPAYFVVDDAPSSAEALDTYAWLMGEWAEAALNGGDLSQCYPVAAAPTKDNANMLKSRVNFIQEKFLPDFGRYIGGRDAKYGELEDSEEGPV